MAARRPVKATAGIAALLEYCSAPLAIPLSAGASTRSAGPFNSRPRRAAVRRSRGGPEIGSLGLYPSQVRVSSESETSRVFTGRVAGSIGPRRRDQGSGELRTGRAEGPDPLVAAGSTSPLPRPPLSTGGGASRRRRMPEKGAPCAGAPPAGRAGRSAGKRRCCGRRVDVGGSPW